MRRPPVEVEDRKAIPKAVKDEVRARAEGRCEHPGCQATKGLDWEHRIPRALGGRSTADNIQLLCKGHHSPKTKADVTRIAKAKRQEKKSFGEKKAPTLRGRGFQKGPKQKIQPRPWPRKNKAPGA